ncbi:hypothetical protein EGW08_007525 [Elysia chlorotica]|uniref:G-protein coupled receptors family 1 profile domain-containing protein n=1 Tax=Elysia chlorotica TaxID=188477 RepID=A0A3S0ZQZ3_ELYCH|nr:hypothetical protein EGW08_007525 [Elysia chlorotica]
MEMDVCAQAGTPSAASTNRASDERPGSDGRRGGQGAARQSSSTPAASGEASVVRCCRVTNRYSSRRRVIRLLVVVVCAFAVLVLPSHLVKLIQICGMASDVMGSFLGYTVVSRMLMYMNSAVNPILYTFVSQSFRRSLKEAFCSCRSKTARCLRARRRAPKPDTSAMPNTGNSSL